MLTKTDINYELRFPQVNNGENIRLFHCHKCGCHPHAMVTGYRKQDSEILYTRVMSVYPGRIDVIETVVLSSYPADFEIIECIVCMNCGGLGEMVVISRIFLENSGLILRYENNHTKRPHGFTAACINFIKNVRKVLRRKR